MARQVASMLGCVALLASACERAHLSEYQQSKLVGEAQVRALVFKRYEQLFGDKYMLRPDSHTHMPFPRLVADEIECYVDADGNWTAYVDRPAGLNLLARVGRQGEWTEFIRVGFTIE